MRLPLFFASLAAALCSGAALAEEAWLTPEGAGGMRWGSTSQPVGAIPRSRAQFLPDSGYVGRSAADRPDDLEVPGPHPGGERRFLRYVGGELVDAWVLRPGPIDVSAYAYDGEELWTGVVLGPSEDGFRAFGAGQSWRMGDRTVLHWRDRSSTVEVLASRAAPSGRYGLERAEPLKPMGSGLVKARLKGDLKPWVEPVADALSGCLENAPKPVIAELSLAYDSKGQPGRIKVNTDQPEPSAVECFAGAVVSTSAPPGTAGSVEVFRMR